MTRDFSKIRACGPWVYIRKVDPGDSYSLDALGSGLYYSTGTGDQRRSAGRGLVVSAGPGCIAFEGEAPNVNRIPHAEDGEFVEMPRDIVPGAIVAYRGYLEEANQVHQWLAQDYCFIHMTSLLGIWEELELVEKDEKLVEKPTSPFFDVAAGSLPKGKVYEVGEVRSVSKAEFERIEQRPGMFMGVDMAKK